jgi:DNA damage-binding protein 1
MAAVGLWSMEVCVYALPTLEPLTREVLGGEVIPRSVLFCAFEGVPYLLVALGDGHLFNFLVDTMSGALSDRKKISLGTQVMTAISHTLILYCITLLARTVHRQPLHALDRRAAYVAKGRLTCDVALVASQPITLSTFRSKNTTHVFAASDRPTVIYSSNKKLLYSNVNLREVSHMCPFNSAAFPDSLAISVENNLTIGTIDDIQKLHIRTVKLNEFPRRIVHQEQTRTFGILTVNLQTEQGFVRLLDAQTFEVSYCLATTPMGTWTTT